MNDTHVLEAIDAAQGRISFCPCGEPLTIGVHDGAAWLECPRFAQPTRLPSRLAFLVAFAREVLHDRRFVVDVPAAPAAPVTQRQAPGARRAASVVTANHPA